MSVCPICEGGRVRGHTESRDRPYLESLIAKHEHALAKLHAELAALPAETGTVEVPPPDAAAQSDEAVAISAPFEDPPSEAEPSETDG
jgi:hypothetical protein